MDELRFEWDPNKNKSNINKHGVGFEEAESVFYDYDAIIIPDPEHSFEEERFLILGMTANLRLLVVCHCYRSEESVIRIISARRATNSERKQYEGE